MASLWYEKKVATSSWWKSIIVILGKMKACIHSKLCNFRIFVCCSNHFQHWYYYLKSKNRAMVLPIWDDVLYTWLFLRISRVSPLENFHFNIMAILPIYSDENFTKIMKLSHHEFPHLVQNRENISTRNIWHTYSSTVTPRYNEVLGTMIITLLYQVSHYIRVKKQRNIKSWDQQNYLVIRGFCFI